MMRKSLIMSFELAAHGRDLSLDWLGRLRQNYQSSDLPPQIKQARITALERKMEALKAITLDANAYPWSEDFT